MKTVITWHRCDANTVNGEQIEIKFCYTSFDKSEIDDLQKFCEKAYADGLVIDGSKMYGRKEDKE